MLILAEQFIRPSKSIFTFARPALLNSLRSRTLADEDTVEIHATYITLASSRSAIRALEKGPKIMGPGRAAKMAVHDTIVQSSKS